ncbi:hypothetical protein EC9_09220 [Rosistilla ulvae]|uniref:Uncharacterized protein n=1 Tax=Rosistilla ulvae TaxID=1930277 RepID=A0A517LVV1_9BACT|nr:ATPase [Rosistilla ulvae]QDS86748.1 hypothetical protein EC9_09220 [Rosistilla ulvae]
MPKFRKVPACLADVVHQVISDLDLEERFRVEVDIPDDIPMPAPARPLAEIVSALAEQATASMEAGGEVAFIGWESPEACELEIADTRCGVLERPCNLPAAMQMTGAELSWQNCPQGGAAVTVRFAKQQISRQAA